MLSLVIFSLVTRGGWRKQRALVAMTVLWLWMGLGIFRTFNPWLIHIHLPILQSAHVQSRLLLLSHLLMLVMAAHALQKLSRPIAIIAGLWLFAEASFVHLYATDNYYKVSGGTALYRPQLAYKYAGTKKTAYFSADYNDAYGGVFCYEPSWFRIELYGSPIKFIGENDYLGEAYFESGQGSAAIEEYTPARLVLSYDATNNDGDFLVVNTNTLSGFVITEGNEAVRIVSSRFEPLRLEGLTGKGQLVLRYQPWYVWPAIGATVLAWLWALVSLARSRRPRTSVG